MAANLSPGDMIFATMESNVPGREDEPIVLGWNSKEYPLLPGRQTHVPLEAAVNAFGDPRSIDSTQHIPIGDPRSGERLTVPSRSDEVRRLRLRYAIYDGDDTNFKNGEGNEPIPKVKLSTIDGEDLTTVLEDPYGESTITAVRTVSQENDAAAMIEHMQRQIDALAKLVRDQAASDQITSKQEGINDLPADEDTGEPTPDISANGDPVFDDPNEIPEDIPDGAQLDELPEG